MSYQHDYEGYAPPGASEAHIGTLVITKSNKEAWAWRDLLATQAEMSLHVMWTRLAQAGVGTRGLGLGLPVYVDKSILWYVTVMVTCVCWKQYACLFVQCLEKTLDDHCVKRLKDILCKKGNGGEHIVNLWLLTPETSFQLLCLRF